MAYAIITKRTFRTENVSRNARLKEKLGRELAPEEMFYETHTHVRYVCVIRPKLPDYEIRTTKFKRDAIFYTKGELPMVKYRLKDMQYYIIDSQTNEEIERIPAAINIALSEPETIGDLKINA